MIVKHRSPKNTSGMQPEGQENGVAPKQPKRIGLAISSGGARGLAHVGVIQVLEKNNIPIAAVAGTSMGAYVGALWCAGYNGQQLRELAEEIQTPEHLRQLSDVVIPPIKGLFGGYKVKAHLRRSLGDVTFDRLIRPLYVVTTDINTRERIVCHKGKVIDAVHASCAMPGVIVPVQYEGHTCVDGGVVDPVPVSVLRKFADVDVVIAISTIPSLSDIEHCDLQLKAPPPKNLFRRLLARMFRPVNLLAQGNIIDIFTSSLKASQVRLAHDSCKRADLVIKPISCEGRWYDYHEYDHFIQVGREVAEKALPQIRALLDPTTDETKQSELVGKCLN